MSLLALTLFPLQTAANLGHFDIRCDFPSTGMRAVATIYKALPGWSSQAGRAQDLLSIVSPEGIIYANEVALLREELPDGVHWVLRGVSGETRIDLGAGSFKDKADSKMVPATLELEQIADQGTCSITRAARTPFAFEPGQLET